MTFNRNKWAPSSVAPPPRTLNVQKFAECRAYELESLHSIVAARVNKNFCLPRNKRRRTACHDNRIAKHRCKKLRLEKDGENEVCRSNEDGSELPRRIRRRNEFKSNPQFGFITSQDGTKRLRTHVWHAKRFTMTKQWGLFLPLGLQGRGRGSRSILRKLKNGALIHDASYFYALQLEGSEDSLMAILRMVLEPSPFSSELSQFISCGDLYGNGLLHHLEADRKLIAPVTYMWQPVIVGGAELSTARRQLWIWIHAAAFNEAFDCLKSVCQKQANDSGVSVECHSLEGKLAKLEIFGTKATKILRNMLYPVPKYNELEDQKLKKCTTAINGSMKPSLDDIFGDDSLELSHGKVLPLTVLDPRDLPSKGCSGILDTFMSEESVLKIIENDSEDSNCPSLWDFHDGINPPLPENILCQEKHRRKMEYFYIEDSDILTSGTVKNYSRRCPILLLRNRVLKKPCSGWSIVIPISWVKAFWVPLISTGAQAIGLRERRWIVCNEGVSCFPYDFPETDAYSQLMKAESEAADEKAKLRPLAMRPLRIPIPPPWNCIWGSDKNHHSESSFPGFVARTSNVLKEYLTKVHDNNHLLLFPNAQVGTNCFPELMNENRNGWIWKCMNQMQPNDDKPFFLRVLLRAFKEGSFEEGAVVCAPFLSDISLWTSRCDEQEEAGLQISQSSLRTYFIQKPTGEWELQAPEDQSSLQLFRSPIGFISTGFVRGSIHPTAIALCEATLLSCLRKQQWNEMPGKEAKPEIFVLVRNLRSTSYRLALATIVLEQCEDDLVFM